MPKVFTSFIVPGLDPDAAFDLISDFKSYPDLTDAVVAVELKESEQPGIISTWTVKFRRGLLCWTEQDVLDREAGEIEFHQLEGDFEVFDGYWRVRAVPEGTEVQFEAHFDLGIPTLADLLDPVAERALRDNIALILAGLFGEIHQVAKVS
jgi:ribosome-associated toxin RatA of RatAB toxin-antitoxin module